MNRTISIIIYCLLTTGCAAIGGYPKPSTDPEIEIKSLKKYFVSEEVVKCRESSGVEEARFCRDNLVNGRIRAVNIRFNTFIKELAQDGVTGNILTDWTVLALTATATVAGGAGAKAALAAASAGLIGAKGAFDKNAYYDKTMPAIVTRMVAERKKVLATIREGLVKENFKEYPLDKALDDVDAYYAAGTIPGAISAVTEDAGKTAQDADSRIQIALKARPAEFVSAERQNRVKALIEKVATLSDTAVLSLNNSPPVALDKESEKAFQTLYEHKNDQESEEAFKERMKKHKNDPKVAREALKFRILIDQREFTSMNAWEAAINSVK